MILLPSCISINKQNKCSIKMRKLCEIMTMWKMWKKCKMLWRKLWCTWVEVRGRMRGWLLWLILGKMERLIMAICLILWRIGKVRNKRGLSSRKKNSSDCKKWQAQQLNKNQFTQSIQILTPLNPTLPLLNQHPLKKSAHHPPVQTSQQPNYNKPNASNI